MSRIKYILLFFIIVIASSCHKYYYDSDYPCAFCYTEEPYEGLLTIYLTIDENHKNIPIVIYDGLIEQGDTIWVDTANNAVYDILVPIDGNYTVTAEYTIENKKVIAVDAAKVFMRRNNTDCEEECWVVFDGFIETELKYEEL
jgi:hypothetical protein